MRKADRKGPGSLKEYKKKRDFVVTREPSGSVKKGAKGRSFVIQKHHARRLHWDLRLEVNGVLASWAVPKEPPRHTGVKRLAVHVEDHPLEYGSFEGEIPKGEYGAGKVEIWDKGTYESEGDVERQIEDGKLVFTLHGDRLEGTYGLVRMKSSGEEAGKDNWLLFKEGREDKLEEPQGVKSGKAPKSLAPMLCATKKQPPAGPDWMHEIKWDGYRVLAFIEGEKVTLKTRNDNKLSLPEIEKALSDADEIEDGVIDGEVVALDERGITSFKLAHSLIRSKSTSELILFAFDLPFFAGMDLRATPIEQRKALLERLLEQIGSERLRYSAHSVGNGPELFEQACEGGLEGIISKKLGSAYASKRSENWSKARCETQLEGWVGGFTRLSSGEDLVGALLVGVRTEEGELIYAGKVGTGFSTSLRHELWRKLSERRIEATPFEHSPDLPKRGAFWVEPDLPVTAQYLEWSEGGVMRQPKLVRVGEESPSVKKEEAKAPENRRPAPKASRKGSNDLPVKISNPDRTIDEKSRLTKGDVAAYYHEVSKWILPYVESRPLPVLRCPDGITGSCFFHKHWMRGLPDAVAKVDIEEESGEDEPYMAIRDEIGLLSLAQMGVVELHPWGSRVEALEQPDTLIFDLDPGEGMEWGAVAEAAHLVRGELQSLKLETFAKLSGGKGVHLVLPIVPELEWDKAKAFCESFSREMARRNPKLFTAELPKAKRKGKIFLDYLRNGRGATAVCAYSLRARPGLPAAMPVEWDEVSGELEPNAFTLLEALSHLAQRKKDPWSAYGKAKQSLVKALGLS